MKITFLRTIAKKIKEWGRKFSVLTARDGNPMTDELPPYSNCLNCGTELNGMYCHKCGQNASVVNPGRRDFVKEYIFNILPVERVVLPTFCTLVFHPGRLPKEYCAGRYVSYMHPLKLNLLILLILITLFSLMGTDAKIKRTIDKSTEQEQLISEMSLSAISDDDDYLEKMTMSPRDTVTLAVSNVVLEKHPGVVEVVDVVSLTDEEHPDTLVAVVPTVLIDDRLLVQKDGVYAFSCDNDIVSIDAMSLAEIEKSLLLLFTKFVDHFPLLMLLTAPFLVLALNTILRRRKLPKGNLYVFSFYYLAFVDFVLAVLYVAGMIFGFSLGSVSVLLRIILFIYLTAAMKNCYGIVSWFKSALAALFVNILYVVMCFSSLLIVSVVVLLIMLMPLM